MKTVTLKKSDPEFGLIAGRKYKAKPYLLDPMTKVVIVIGGKEICTQYRNNIIYL